MGFGRREFMQSIALIILKNELNQKEQALSEREIFGNHLQIKELF